MASPERFRDEVVRLSNRGLGVRDYSLAVARILRRAVPFDGVCVMTMDPATLLPTGHVIENGLPDEATPRLAEIEAMEPDFNKFTELARNQARAGTLSAATDGRLQRSARHRELRGPHGFADELRAALADASGTWGGVVLDARGRPRRLRPGRRDAARRAGLAPDRGPATGDPALGPVGERGGARVGLLLLTEEDTVALANAAAELWLGELRGSDDGVRLPFVVHAVADRARNIAAGRMSGPASARVRAPSGRWLLVRGSMLGDGADARTAVLLEAAQAPELAPLIADGYGLTQRERTVTQLVAQGRPRTRSRAGCTCPRTRCRTTSRQCSTRST